LPGASAPRQHADATVPAMKTLGLIGGLTWLSTVEYYRAINE
jgi:hypothetical protein